jgi:hypothetical protein
VSASRLADEVARQLASRCAQWRGTKDASVPNFKFQRGVHGWDERQLRNADHRTIAAGWVRRSSLDQDVSTDVIDDIRLVDRRANNGETGHG